METSTDRKRSGGDVAVLKIPVNALVLPVVSVLALILLLAGTVAVRADAEVPATAALRVDEPPVLDGHLDDLCWRRAVPVSGFVQQDPNLGASPGFDVELRLASTPSTLYLGFAIHSGDPGDLVATVVQRDGPVLDSDDCIGFALDTFHNHRDAYYFIVNSLGVRQDGRIADDGVSIDPNWDGNWQVRTALLNHGWSGEIAIPLHDLRFRETADGTWGLGVVVSSVGRSEHVIWPNYGKSSSRVSQYGHFEGMRDLEARQPLVLLPYVINGSRFGRSEEMGPEPGIWRPMPDSWERALGLDLRYSPTTSLRLNLALNPDFATVEADQFVFNLTVDELSLPERRPFFVEGTEIFQTAHRLLYTRRIGLGEDEMLGGGKIMGRVGAYSFAAMEVVTGTGIEPQNSYAAVRLKRDLFGSSALGIMAVGKEGLSGHPAHNRAVGADLNLQLHRTTRLVASLSRTQRNASGGEGQAASLDFQYIGSLLGASDLLDLSLGLTDVGAGFDLDEIGYMPDSRRDRRGVESQIAYTYSLRRRGIDDLSLQQKGWYYQDHAGVVKLQDGISTEFSLRTRSLIRPALLLERSVYFDRDDDERFRNWQRTISLELGPYPRFGGEFSYRTGDNFGDAVRFVSAVTRVKPYERMVLTANLHRLHRDPLDRIEPASTDVIGILGVDYLFSTDLYGRVLIQGNSGDDRFLVNGMLRYEIQAGSAFYLSFRETRDKAAEQYVASDRLLLAKFSYLWRL